MGNEGPILQMTNITWQYGSGTENSPSEPENPSSGPLSSLKNIAGGYEFQGQSTPGQMLQSLPMCVLFK